MVLRFEFQAGVPASKESTRKEIRAQNTAKESSVYTVLVILRILLESRCVNTHPRGWDGRPHPADQWKTNARSLFDFHIVVPLQSSS